MRALLNETMVILGDHTVTFGSAFYAMLVVMGAMVLLRVIKGLKDHRARANPEQASRLHSAFLLLKYGVWVAVIVTCLELLGFNITFFIAGSAALLVGLGLGLQQTFMDVVSGIIILAEGTIRVGDVLEVEGLVGRVTTINLRTSTVYSRDGMNVIVPNHRFINENVVNWS
ncbi:MAG: mechanosensitive ion channel, partial [Flavobacteriales bacterium]|nr:mechanosensitive ion channel [Flavobacteriales bacterium]